MMDSLAHILGRKPQGGAIIKGVAATMTVELANTILAELISPEISKFAVASYIKNGVLCIACTSTVVAQEIKLRERDLLERLNAGRQTQEITKIRYML